jgi:hypothetical protein
MQPRALIFAAAVGLAFASPAHAALVDASTGTSFEPRPKDGGTAFLCLGAGHRKVLFWTLYAMDFCAEDGKLQTALDGYFAGPGRAHAGLKGKALARALVDDQGFFDWLTVAPFEKRAEMVFLRGGDAETARNGFAKNLEKFLGSGAREKEAIRAFVSVIDRPVASGDRAIFVTFPAGELTFSFGANARTLRQDKAVSAFWGAYLGPDSPLGSMKEAIAEGVAGLRGA